MGARPASFMLCPQYCSRSRRGTLGDRRHGVVASVDSLGLTNLGSWPGRWRGEAVWARTQGCVGLRGRGVAWTRVFRLTRRLFDDR